MNRKKQGFTLIEMMMVMGILAMIIALGIPIYSAMAMGKSLSGASDIVTGVFLKYREVASAKGIPIFLMFEHWHMDRNLPTIEQVPPVLKAFTVTQHVEITPDKTISSWVFNEIDEQIKFPKGIWFNDNWVNNELVLFKAIAPSEPFSKEANALCTKFYKMDEDPVLWNNDPKKTRWDKKLFMVVFLPNGTCAIIGKRNVGGPWLDEDPPNADIWMTNGDDTMLIEINTNTGRTRKRLILDLEK